MVQARISTRADTVPTGWWRMSVPQLPEDSHERAREEVEQARIEGIVVDISSSPAYWGQFVQDENLVMVCGGKELAHAADRPSAVNLVQAHLIQCLSAIGREYLDYYFLEVESPLKPEVANGAMLALVGAREEGHIRCLGVTSNDAQSTAVQVWTEHPIFGAALLTRPDSNLETLAKQDNALIVATYEGPHPILSDRKGTRS